MKHGIVDINRYKPIMTPVLVARKSTADTRGLPMPAEEGGSVLTIDELAEYLKTWKSTLCKLAQVASIPGQKVGKHWRFHKDAVDEWLRQRGPFAPLRKRNTETYPNSPLPGHRDCSRTSWATADGTSRLWASRCTIPKYLAHELTRRCAWERGATGRRGRLPPQEPRR